MGALARVVAMIGLVVICVLLTSALIVYRPPAFVIRYFQRRWPDVLWEIQTPDKVIALTIDDGPFEYTSRILDVLIANGATATFFVIGSHMKGREELLRRMVREGHELGNHAMHDEPSYRLTDTELATRIREVDEMIARVYSTCKMIRPARLFRPGSGFFSSPMRRTVKTLGYRLVLGGVYPHDPQIQFWRLNAWHVRSLLRPGAIVICHDRQWTVPMLESLLPHLRITGYRVTTVTEALASSDSSSSY
jgi:peptidoglycan/xylan/chitin deacetylase (PgdA/CDA1 family)